MAIPTLGAGAHSITAKYSGDANFASSTSAALTETITVAATTTTVSSSLNPATYGQAITLTATVQPPAGTSATGSVTFLDGSTTLGTATLSSNSAQLAVTLAAGSHTITASYGGNANLTASVSSALTETVNKAETTTAISSSVNPSNNGQAVTLTASIQTTTGSPTGTVTFLDGTTTLGSSSISNGAAQLVTSTLAVGTHSLTAEYSGDSNFLASNSSTLKQTVNQAGFACHVGYAITNQWRGGFQAALTINNTGTVGISSWTVTWTFANGQTVTQLWNGSETQSGANVTVKNLSYNGTIPAGGSYTGMGFNGSWNNTTNAVPASFAVNGTTCN